MKGRMVDPVCALFRFIERQAAKAQGKGYGTATVRRENQLVHEVVGDEPVLAVDVGGNVGNYTAELRRRHPRLEIHVFEPSRVNVETLRQRFSGDRAIRIQPMAVSDLTGPATLFSDEDGSALASLARRRLDHFGLRFEREESVNAVRFDDYWRTDLACRPVDILKLDIEGHELRALEGCGRALGSIRVIQFEFGGCNVDTRTYFQDFWYFFARHGFELHRVTPIGLERISRYRESDEFFSTTNYIAVNRSSNEGR